MGLFDGVRNFLFGDTNIPNYSVEEQIAQQRQQAAEYAQREQQDYLRQVQMAQYLQRVIAGQAPSVAQGQLVAGMDQAQRAANSQAAGATGTNASLARYGSILTGGNLAAMTNQQAAQLRAQETAQAVAATGALTNSMGQRSAVLGQGADQLGLDYNKLNFGIESGNREQANKETGAVMTGIGDAAAMYFSGGTSAIPKQNQAR